MTGQVPMNGNENPWMNSSKTASTTVRPRIRKPPNTKTCAMPGTLHLSSFFCPSTSVTSASSRVAGSLVRSTAGWPDRMRRVRKPARFRAKNAATKMMTMPTPARSAIDGSMAPPGVPWL